MLLKTVKSAGEWRVLESTVLAGAVRVIVGAEIRLAETVSVLSEA